MELFAEMNAQLVGHIMFGERAVHAPQPFVTLARANCKGQVSRAQSRMAVPFNVNRWSAGPSGEIEVQLFARRFETLGMECANRRGFGRAVDEIVEAVDEAADASVAAETRERS